MDRRHATDDGEEEPAADSTEETGLDSNLRRRLLTSTASVGALATAGCLGILGDGSETGPRPGEPTPYDGTETPDGTTTPGTVEAFDVEFLKEETTLSIGSDTAVLDAALDADLDIPYQCQIGVCGQCTSKITNDGDPTELVEHDGNQYLSDAQIEAGYMLTCVGYPRSDFSLETGVKDEADSYSPGGETETPPETTTTPGEIETHSIEYVEQGGTIDVASDEALLDAGLDEDWDMPYQCQVGVCGQCTSKVDGDGSELVEHDGNQYLSDEQIQEGYVLTCVGYPRDDFSLTTGKKDEADQI
ncbi:2Fe-2S iron-sulfur cluster-binding protein [Halapricum hydrolyticum]|uniref:2Fe-2S iron-sulfur cluster-binding protein n=1 Tax=Halapricum hydrolyticum TaxID=2979991 RepID=A0AAE3IAM6_9EURY|nr:2Fe-2S iron-sulfur cluster-binding protein [Halapricum hydrolyticum]MCU4717418.1 2Fe-2S iron-sulfur cluster-binding protein [Halapricum hydrolyticum]MCU4726582.1 2Fe-2S iron-sulfur cluster-binding protein [Halapricum hydrolyticum]